MKFIVATTALFAGLAAAAPKDMEVTRGYDVVELEFWAAADNTFGPIVVYVDGSAVAIDSDLSFSSITSTSYASGNVVCHVYGVDSSDTVLENSETVDIGPPQVQTYATCVYSD